MPTLWYLPREQTLFIPLECITQVTNIISCVITTLNLIEKELIEKIQLTKLVSPAPLWLWHQVKITKNWCGSVKLNGGYRHAQSERSHAHSAQERANISSQFKVLIQTASRKLTITIDRHDFSCESKRTWSKQTPLAGGKGKVNSLVTRDSGPC